MELKNHMEITELTEEEIELVLSHRRNKQAVEENEETIKTGKLKKNLYFTCLFDNFDSYANSVESYFENIKHFDEKERVKIEKDLLKLAKDFLNDLFDDIKIKKGEKFFFNTYFEWWENDSTFVELSHMSEEEEKDFLYSIKEVKVEYV